MTDYSRMRLLADYLAATRNEIAVDEMLLRMAHATPDRLGYLPRVPIWLGKAKRAPALTRTVWRFAWLAWWLGGALVYFVLELLKLERLRRDPTINPTKSAPLAEGAILGFSTRVCDVVNPQRFPGLPTTWLTCPWAPQHTLPKAAIELPIMTLVSSKDIRDSVADALRATYALAGDSSQSRWMLQSYTAVRWFLVRRAVDRLHGALVTAEHFDRWAVLADRSVRAGRRKGRSRQFAIVQHGVVGGLGSDVQGAGALKAMPTRLTCVDNLYVYDADEEATFRRAVIAETADRNRLRVQYFKPTIELTGDRSNQRLRLLFVGHPLCEAFQTTVYRSLRDAGVVDAFYKPHPKAPMSAAMTKVGWAIVDNPQVFPRVDLLVSYPSTLVIEYAAAGVPASVHPLDIGADALPQFIERTRRMIHSLGDEQPNHPTEPASAGA